MRFFIKRQGLARFAIAFSALLSLLTFGQGFLGCARAADIHLQGGPAQPPPEDQPEGGTKPTPAPSPGPMQPTPDPGTEPNTGEPTDPAPRYRMLCDDHYPPFMTAISSLAGPLSFGAAIKSGPANTPSGQFDPLRPNVITRHEAPVYAARLGQDLVRSIFIAEDEGDASLGRAREKFIYVSDLDILRRFGLAIKLGTPMTAEYGVSKLSDLDGVTVRTFGASDSGRYFLVGTKLGYELRDAVTRASLGVVKVGSAAKFVNPAFRESDRLFSVAEVVNGSWTTHFYVIDFNAQGLVAATKAVASVSGLARPLSPLYRLKGAATSFSGNLFYALTSDRKELRLWNSAQRQSENFLLSGIPTTGGRLAVSAALTELANGQLELLTVYENFEVVPIGGMTKYMVRDSVLRRFIVDRQSATAKFPGTGDIPYPAEAKRVLEAGSYVFENPGVRDLQVTSDGEAIFGLFAEGGMSKRVFRLQAGTAVPVSQNVCQNMSIGVE